MSRGDAVSGTERGEGAPRVKRARGSGEAAKRGYSPGKETKAAAAGRKPNSVPFDSPRLSARLAQGDDHSSSPVITDGIKQPTRKPRTGRPMIACCQANAPPYLALLRAGFCLPRPLPAARCALTAPFHPYRRLGLAASPQAVYFLCHWSVGLPRPGITRHTALWSSDFPLPHALRRAVAREGVADGYAQQRSSGRLQHSIMARAFGA